jgi:hypothetical protein
MKLAIKNVNLTNDLVSLKNIDVDSIDNQHQILVLSEIQNYKFWKYDESGILPNQGDGSWIFQDQKLFSSLCSFR